MKALLVVMMLLAAPIAAYAFDQSFVDQSYVDQGNDQDNVCYVDDIPVPC